MKQAMFQSLLILHHRNFMDSVIFSQVSPQSLFPTGHTFMIKASWKQYCSRYTVQNVSCRVPSPQHTPADRDTCHLGAGLHQHRGAQAQVLGWIWTRAFFLFVLFFLLFWGMPLCMWDPSSPTRDWTRAPALEARSLNHWTTREVPERESESEICRLLAVQP